MSAAIDEAQVKVLGDVMRRMFFLARYLAKALFKLLALLFLASTRQDTILDEGASDRGVGVKDALLVAGYY